MQFASRLKIIPASDGGSIFDNPIYPELTTNHRSLALAVAVEADSINSSLKGVVCIQFQNLSLGVLIAV